MLTIREKKTFFFFHLSVSFSLNFFVTLLSESVSYFYNNECGHVVSFLPQKIAIIAKSVEMTVVSSLGNLLIRPLRMLIITKPKILSHVDDIYETFYDYLTISFEQGRLMTANECNMFCE
jgi:hypothetical protein